MKSIFMICGCLWVLGFVSAQDQPKKPEPAKVEEPTAPTPLTADEDRALMFALLQAKDVEIQRLQALIESRLGLSQIQLADRANSIFNALAEDHRKKHNAVGQQWDFASKSWKK